MTIAVEAESGVSYIGWRSSSSGASYTDKTGFTDITSKREFSVSANDWYAICAVDGSDNFAYKLIQITNIQTSSGGGGGGTSTAYYAVTFDSNGSSAVDSQSVFRNG